ncbi:hypothetical protein ACFO25_10055 [Paenactinomyces guangxiensis]|uniref:Uncharacterized protein n=1 Tax=Paenactinomyces guangxiensis TaxID=1490290 RepID=A0A7W1WS93_9BACL|nr:hypothetical protein [Paenactinomyces guangxiensis]MBA4495128.1 hypothetical protein [Paenactinomyces guangxiensis]MBH8592188.1 hypothetical protein [Paenactinomyces guangxiensis]
MELVRESEYIDVYRIENGVILEVRKYMRTGWRVWHSPKYSEPIEGTPGAYRLKRKYKDLPKGTVIIDGFPVETIKEPDNFETELRLSGGVLYGTIDKHARIYTLILDILNDYREGLV